MRKIFLVAVCAFLFPVAAAADNKQLVSTVCTGLMPTYEKLYNIPSKVLVSIAQGESGVYSKDAGKVVPWPWTLGVEGKGFYFNSEPEAVVALKKLVARGVRNIDIGCMQINYTHHPEAFPSLDYAFNPAYNVSYAAKFLRSNYDETKSWKTAIAYYHSRTPEHAVPYMNSVVNRWMANSGRTAKPSVLGNGVKVASNDNKVSKVSLKDDEESNTTASLNIRSAASILTTDAKTRLAAKNSYKANPRDTGAVIKVQNQNGVKIVRMMASPNKNNSMVKTYDVAHNNTSTAAHKGVVKSPFGRSTPVDFIFD